MTEEHQYAFWTERGELIGEPTVNMDKGNSTKESACSVDAATGDSNHDLEVEVLSPAPFDLVSSKKQSEVKPSKMWGRLKAAKTARQGAVVGALLYFSSTLCCIVCHTHLGLVFVLGCEYFCSMARVPTPCA